MSEENQQTLGDITACENAALKSAIILLAREISTISPGVQGRVAAQLREGAEKIVTVPAQSAPGFSAALSELADLMENT